MIRTGKQRGSASLGEALKSPASDLAERGQIPLGTVDSAGATEGVTGEQGLDPSVEAWVGGGGNCLDETRLPSVLCEAWGLHAEFFLRSERSSALEKSDAFVREIRAQAGGEGAAGGSAADDNIVCGGDRRRGEGEEELRQNEGEHFWCSRG